jgi:phosphate transport system protein
MKRRADQDIENLRMQLTGMGINVQEAIDAALDGLRLRDSVHFERVYQIESSINAAHKVLDEICVDILARTAPLAADLRFLVSAIKVNSDLERMGDLAVNVAHNGERYIAEPALLELVELPQMVENVKWMVSQSLTSFLQNDVNKAQAVLQRDDTVDAFKNQIMKKLVEEHMMKNPMSIHSGLDLILIARNLERIGDHATNIAEDAIYVAQGIDVRHGARISPPAGAPNSPASKTQAS